MTADQGVHVKTIWKRLAASVTVVMALLTVAAPAHAKPKKNFGWVLTASTGAWPASVDAAPQTNSEPPRAAAKSSRTGQATTLAAVPGEEALRNECVNQHADAAQRVEGWMKDRFNRCFMGHRKIELKCVNCSTVIASVEFDYVLVGMTMDGTRQADFVLTFDDWEAWGGIEREVTPMRVSLGGCGSLVSCNPSDAEVTLPLGSWQALPRMHVTYTSADQTGIGDEYLAHASTALGLAVLPLDPKTVPYVETGMTRAVVRFDSAGARAGKYNGAIFSDFIPTFDLLKLARADNYESGVKESVLHINDALYRPIRTFPSFPGKSVPGRYRPEAGANQRPLHRLVNTEDQNKNRTYAGKVCDDVWGPLARNPDLNCDEYPFASTREGAYTGSTVPANNPDGWRTWHGSSRLIGEVDNQDSGRDYLNRGFYHANRILDGDAFFVDIDRTVVP